MADSHSWWYDRGVPIGLVALVLVGAYNRQAPLVALAATLLFLLLLTRFWSHHSTRALSYERRLSDDRAFPGDNLGMELRLANDKLLPLPWLEIDDRLPKQLLLHSEDGLSESDPDGHLRLAASVSWKERVRWRYQLQCTHRGVYSLGPATVATGDPFGFFPRSIPAGEIGELVVYPRLVPLAQLGLPSGFPLGDARSRRWIFEDASRTVGVRDYRREDSFRRIHWKATARHQQLQVKLHEPTTTLEVALFLGLDTFARGAEARERGDAGKQDGQERQDRREGAGENPAPNARRPAPNARRPAPNFEYAVSVAASLAHHLIGQKHPVGLYINGGAPDSGEGVDLPPGGSQEQLIRILETLARVEPLPTLSLETLLSRVAPGLPWGSSLVVVAGGVSESLLATLQSLAHRGHRPVVLHLDDADNAESFAGVALHHLGQTGDAARE